MYTIKAKTTKYKNTTYRSQLESKYAHLFDLLNILHQYEPKAPETGFNWLPDFNITLEGYDFFVEVKPSIKFLNKQLPHIKKQAITKPVLILVQKTNNSLIIYNHKGNIKTEIFPFFSRFKEKLIICRL